jgi:adenylate cyclase
MWSRFKRLIWQWGVVVITAPSIAALVIVMRLLGFLQPLEWAMLDQYFYWRPQEPSDPRIVLVQITENDLVRYGWPIPDGVLADVLNRLNAQQPRAIGLDLYRNLPVGEGYDKLVQTFEAIPHLIGIQKVVGGVDAGPIAPASILLELNQVGANDAILDADGRIRRGFLYLDDEDGKTVLSLASRLALLYLEPEGITPQMTSTNEILLGKAKFVPFEANDGAYVNANDQGFQVFINFRGPRGHFSHVSIQQVLEGQLSPNLVRDRVVLIGSTAESVSDYYETPFSSHLEKQMPQLMAGVEIMANLTSQILSGALQGRSTLRVWSEPMEWFWVLVWATVGTTLSWQQRTTGRSMRSRWFKTSLTILLASGTLILVSYLAFLKSWWIPVIPPLLALLGAAVVVTGFIAQMATKIRKTFGRYLSDEVVTSLLETPTGLQLGGEKRKITMLMSDLRGFSAISESLPPEQVVKLLNLYLETMTEIVAHYGGLVNQVIGDGMVIFFGALTQRPDDATRAVACAIAMQLAMERVNQRNHNLGLPTIEMGIGINTGEVIVGNIGSLKHAQFTAIGSDVNLAARIESSSVGGQVLVSQAVVDEVPSLIIRRQIEANLKGMHSPVTFYEVGSIGVPHNLGLPDPKTNLLSLQIELPIQFMLVEGKQLIGPAIRGTLVKVSGRGAEICSEVAIAPLCNIRIMLLSPAKSDRINEDIYAKVTDTSTDNRAGFRVHFTNISPQMLRALLKQTIKSPKSAVVPDKY